jgi:hypothetical protein
MSINDKSDNLNPKSFQKKFKFQSDLPLMYFVSQLHCRYPMCHCAHRKNDRIRQSSNYENVSCHPIDRDIMTGNRIE